MSNSTFDRILALAERRDANPDDDDAAVCLLSSIDALIVAIDERVSAQLDCVLHAPTFQRLEAAWRGIWHLVSHLRFADRTRVALWSLTREELADDLESPATSSCFYDVLYTSEYGQHGGQPYAAAIFDLEIDASPASIALLRSVSRIAMAAHVCAFFSASPRLLGVSRWGDLRDASDVQDGPSFVAWRALRDREESRHLGLMLPNELGRVPYDEPTGNVGYVETIHADGTGLLWTSPGYNLALRLARVFGQRGMLGTIVGEDGLCPESMVHVDSLALGGARERSSLEARIPSNVERQLRDLGFLTFGQKDGRMVLLGGHSLAAPKDFGRSERGRAATVNHLLGTRIPYMFIACRFAHYLKVIEREQIGRAMSGGELKERLQTWLDRYVLNQDGAPPEMRAVHPLRAAVVVVNEKPDAPGEFDTVVHLQPHIHYLGVLLSLSVRLTDTLAISHDQSTLGAA